MDIRVGKTLQAGGSVDRNPGAAANTEARLLAIRAPRRRSSNPPAGGVDRREASSPRDPVNGRVLVLMIPDGTSLPRDLETGAYRVFLRFARR